MKKVILIIGPFLSLFFCRNVFAQINPAKIERIKGTQIGADSLILRLKHLMSAAHITGLQVTVFNYDTIVFSKSLGYRNASNKVPLESNTAIYAASLSKVVFAIIAMKLVEQDILDLDKPLQEYLEYTCL